MKGHDQNTVPTERDKLKTIEENTKTQSSGEEFWDDDTRKTLYYLEWSSIQNDEIKLAEWQDKLVMYFSDYVEVRELARGLKVEYFSDWIEHQFVTLQVEDIRGLFLTELAFQMHRLDEFRWLTTANEADLNCIFDELVEHQLLKIEHLSNNLIALTKPRMSQEELQVFYNGCAELIRNSGSNFITNP